VSKERVRQLETRAMERLRELAQEANLRDALE
jgi:DNA-directed RNA polymerase sigma subunit (sigma70/sigma32)